MGVEHYVSCKTCKVTRELEKFYSATIYPVETRQQALDFQEKIKSDAFRAGLLVSFMGKHIGHDVVFFNEHTPGGFDEEMVAIDDGDEREFDYRMDTDFWSDR